MNDDMKKEEREVYDRQIRLWGESAQKRLSSCKVCICGLSGVGAEIAKNVVLAGAGTVCVVDNSLVRSSDICASFLLDTSSIGKTTRAVAVSSHLQQLNPFVRVISSEESITNWMNSDSIKDYDIVCLAQRTARDQIQANEKCREHNKLFIASDVFGFVGRMFVDVGTSYAFDEEKKEVRNEDGDVEEVQNTAQEAQGKTMSEILGLVNLPPRTSKWFIFTHLLKTFELHNDRLPEEKELLDYYKEGNFSSLVDEEYIKKCSQCFGEEFAPLCSVVGGISSQEIIKLVTRKGKPFTNFFVYDGVETFAGIIEKL